MAKYLDLNGLSTYDGKIKEYINDQGLSIDSSNIAGDGNAVTDIEVNSSGAYVKKNKTFVEVTDIVESGEGDYISNIVINMSGFGGGGSPAAITIVRSNTPAGVEAITSAEINALFV